MRRLTHEATVRDKQQESNVRRLSHIVVFPGNAPVIDYGPPPEYVWAYRFYAINNIVYYPIFF